MHWVINAPEQSAVQKQRFMKILEWMKCEYMDGKVGDIEPGVIIGVTGFGLFIELSDVLIEGLVHVSTLD